MPLLFWEHHRLSPSRRRPRRCPKLRLRRRRTPVRMGRRQTERQAIRHLTAHPMPAPQVRWVQTEEKPRVAPLIVRPLGTTMPRPLPVIDQIKIGQTFRVRSPESLAVSDRWRSPFLPRQRACARRDLAQEAVALSAKAYKGSNKR